jgi:hypothetical protein
MSIIGRGKFVLNVVGGLKANQNLWYKLLKKEQSTPIFGLLQNCMRKTVLFASIKRCFNTQRNCVVKVKSSLVSECRKDLMAICFTNPVCQEETANLCLRDVSLCKTLGYNLVMTMEVKVEPTDPAHKIPLRQEIKKRILSATKSETDEKPRLVWHAEESVDTSCFFLTNCGNLSICEIESHIQEKLVPRITDGIATDFPEFGSEWSVELNVSKII